MTDQDIIASSGVPHGSLVDEAQYALRMLGLLADVRIIAAPVLLPDDEAAVVSKRADGSVLIEQPDGTRWVYREEGVV